MAGRSLQKGHCFQKEPDVEFSWGHTAHEGGGTERGMFQEFLSKNVTRSGNVDETQAIVVEIYKKNREDTIELW